MGMDLNFWTILGITAAVIAIAAPVARAEKKPAKTTMYVFAHEDDEIDVAAKMLSEMREGGRVIGVWVTKGDIGGDPVVREKETREAMKLIGLPPENFIFLGYPDQGAFRHFDEIVADLTKIVDKEKPAEITSHAYEGGNIDHDAVAFVSSTVAKKRGVPHYDFPDSNMHKGETRVFEFLPGDDYTVLYTKLDKELYDLKIKLMHAYPSQATGLNAYELIMDKKRLKKFGEPYRVAPDYDFTKPPSEEFRYKGTSRGTATIELFLDAVNAYYKKHAGG